MTNDQSINEVFPLATIKEILPACGPKSLECFKELALTRKEMKEVAVVVTEFKISTYKVASMLTKGITLKEATDIINMAQDYGHLASYNQLVRILQLCGEDLDVVEFFLDIADYFVSSARIPKNAMGHLLHLVEEKYDGDIHQVACILQENDVEEAREIFRGEIPYENWG